MDEKRVAVAVEAAARALHESVRDRHQFQWERMSETWRQEMRSYVRPSVIAALETSDRLFGRPAARPVVSAKPRLSALRR